MLQGTINYKLKKCFHYSLANFPPLTLGIPNNNSNYWENMQTLRDASIGLLIAASAGGIAAVRTGKFGTNTLTLKDSYDGNLGIKYHNIKHTKHVLYEELTYESSDKFIWNPPPVFASEFSKYLVGSTVTSNTEHRIRTFRPIKWEHQA